LSSLNSFKFFTLLLVISALSYCHSGYYISLYITYTTIIKLTTALFLSRKLSIPTLWGNWWTHSN